MKIVKVGGERFEEEIERKVKKVMGWKMKKVLGMEEGMVKYKRIEEKEEIVLKKKGSKIRKEDEIRIVDEDGEKVEEGKKGMMEKRGN